MFYETMKDILNVNKFYVVPCNLVSELYQGILLKAEVARE
jgi:hypothetical protein